jgi:hypothetical protein
MTDDEIIEVRLPLKDYKVMREMIEERQAMTGLKKWITTKFLWAVGGLLSILGLIEALRRLAE